MKLETTDTQAGSLKERHILEDGTEIFLPVGSTLYPRLTPSDKLPDGSTKKPLGGTYD